MPLWKAIDAAYSSLGCDPSTSDENVVIACYARKPSVGGDSLWDLKAIAVDRKSRFHLFV